MIKVFFEKYHDDNHIERFVKTFANKETPSDDAAALKLFENYLFSFMRVPVNHEVMSFTTNAVSVFPDGLPCDGGYWEHKVMEVQNDFGVLFRAHDFCSRDFDAFLKRCRDRVVELPCLGDNVRESDSDDDAPRENDDSCANETLVETSLGTIRVYSFDNNSEKGVCVSLRRDDAFDVLPLSVSSVADKFGESVLETIVFPDATNDDIVFHHKHKNIEDFF